MDYLRRTKIPLPEEFRTILPGYASIRIAVHHTPWGRPHPEDPMNATADAYFYLVPSHGTGGTRAYKEISHVPVEGQTPREVVDEARKKGREHEFLNQLLATYVQRQAVH